MHLKINNQPTPTFRPSLGNLIFWGALSLLLGVAAFVLFFSSWQEPSGGLTRPIKLPASMSGGVTVPSRHFESGCHGQPHTGIIRLFKKVHNGTVLLQNNTRVFEGDQVQIQYQTDTPFGVIFSVDGRGVVTLHYPNRSTESNRIVSGRHLLSFAFVLDDAPGFETFFFVTDKRPINAKALLKHAQMLKTAAETIQPMGSDTRIHRVVLYKQVRNLTIP